MLTGIRSLADSDLVLFGYPDSIWEPIDGFSPLVELVQAGSEVALGLFRTSQVERPDVVELSASGIVTNVEVGSDRPPPHLIWGCFAARVRAMRGLAGFNDPGDYLRSLCVKGSIAGVILSEAYVDVGTRQGLQQALDVPKPAPR